MTEHHSIVVPRVKAYLEKNNDVMTVKGSSLDFASTNLTVDFPILKCENAAFDW
ncbi:MAG: hypothetical protein WA667_03570 [Candidatus Nitrosopolaris sp.]